jgi:VIT1/CCC1 family predicted Fe2+/Mn2+ transporter
MAHLFAILLLVANATTCVRLLVYRRAGARYRPLVSAYAWLLIASTGSTALGVLLGLYPASHIHLGDVGTSLVLCVLSLAARGNVAAIIRTNHDDQPTHPARW